MSKNNGKRLKQDGTEWEPSIPFFPSQSGTGNSSVYVDEEVLATLGKVTAGGRLVLSAAKPSQNPKAPKFRITFYNDADKQQQEESI
jgi:hypothetical protein